MLNKLKKNSFVLGLALGLLMPLIFFALLLSIHYLIITIAGMDQLMEERTMMLLSIVVNLFTLRYYFVSLQFEKTGRAILLMTFVQIILFFLFNQN